MQFLWGIPVLFGLLVVASNAVLYGWRARLVRHAPECSADERLGMIGAAWAFAKECAALAAVALLVPLGWCLPRCRTGTGARGPLILVHGCALNRGSLWLLRRRLLRDGWGPACCFEYGWSVDVERAARQLHEMLESVAAREHRPITCIGHSLGGLVLRYCARRYPAPTVRRIVTLGTPHGGTELARILGHHRRPLLPGSRLLGALNAADHVPQQFDVIAIHSSFDAMVLPPSNGMYPGAFNIQVNDVGHNALLFSAKVYRLIAENLAAPLP